MTTDCPTCRGLGEIPGVAGRIAHCQNCGGTGKLTTLVVQGIDAAHLERWRQLYRRIGWLEGALKHIALTTTDKELAKRIRENLEDERYKV